jgi:hypothetical protein
MSSNDDAERVLRDALLRSQDCALYGFSVVGPDGERVDPRTIKPHYPEDFSDWRANEGEVS